MKDYLVMEVEIKNKLVRHIILTDILVLTFKQESSVVDITS